MKLRILFCLLLLSAALSVTTTAKADCLIVGTDTLRLRHHWWSDSPLDELARNDRIFGKKFQELLYAPTADGSFIIIDGGPEHDSYWRLIDDRLYLDHTIRYSDETEIDFSRIFTRDETGYYPATYFSGPFYIYGIFDREGAPSVFVFKDGQLTYTNWQYPSYTHSPMLGDPLFLHFDFARFSSFTDGLWSCTVGITPDSIGKPVSIQPFKLMHRGDTTVSEVEKRALETAITDSLNNVDFICDVDYYHGRIQAILKTFELPKPVLYRYETHKKARTLVGYRDTLNQRVVPTGKYARCYTPIISENRIGVVETKKRKIFVIDHTGRELFEIVFQPPVLSVEDVFLYGYFVYAMPDGRQGIATISGLQYTQPNHTAIDLYNIDRNTLGTLIR